MAAFLRYAKVLRIFNSFTRNVARSYIQNERTGELIKQTKNIQRNFIRAIATQNIQYGTKLEPEPRSSDSAFMKATLELDRRLYNLDQDLRQIGRISALDIENIFALMKEIGKVSSTQALLAIRCCGSFMPEQSPELRTQLLEDIWDFLKTSGVLMDVSHYNAMLRVYIENEKKFSPTEYITYLEKEGMEPNRVTYQRLIMRYCQEGDIEGASRILEFMKEKNLPVNEHVFNSLIMAHGYNGDMQNAKATVEMMQNAGLIPNSETYTALMCGYARSGDMEQIHDTIKKCDSQDIVLYNKELFEVLYTLVKNGHEKHFDQMVEEIKVTVGYNQDATNICLRFILLGHSELAYKLYNTMSLPLMSDREYYTGAFFLTQLIKCEIAFDKIISYCEGMKNKSLNDAPFLHALYNALVLEKTDIALKMFEYFIQNGIPLKEHYFWPLLMTYRKRKDEEGFLQVVTLMKSVFQFLMYDTVATYMIPNLEGSFVERIKKLMQCGLPFGKTSTATFLYLLEQKDIATAAELAANMNLRYSRTCARELATAYVHTMDVGSTLNILHSAYRTGTQEFLEGHENENIDRDEKSEGQFKSFLDIFLLELIPKAKGAEDIMLILKGLLDLGLGINNTTKQRLLLKLGDEEDKTLSLLTFGNPPFLLSNKQMTPKRAEVGHEKRIDEQIGSHLKLNYLLRLIRSRELQAAMDLKKELEAEGSEIPPSLQGLLLDLNLRFGKLEEAQHLLQESKKYPYTVLDAGKVVKMAQLLVEKNRNEEAMALLNQESSVNENFLKKPERINVACLQLVDVLQEKGDVQAIEEFIDVLLKHKYTSVNTGLCRPLIKIHLKQNDLESAVVAFEKCCKKYRETPMNRILLKKLVEIEDSANLHKVSELLMDIHGEINILYDLICTFIECGRVQQAQKILKTPGMRANNRKLETKCELYVEEGKVRELEELVKLTKDIFSLDRSMMYSYLLKAYCALDDSDKALSLWMLLQEEDVQPSNDFLINLAKLLEKNNRTVPFIVPSVSEEFPTYTNNRELSLFEKFQNALKVGNADEALNYKKQLDLKNMNFYNIELRSALLELLVRRNKISEACKVVEDLYSQNLNVRKREMIMLFRALALAGEVELIERINCLGENRWRLDYLIIKAYMTSGRIEEYITKLEKQIKSSLLESSVTQLHFPFEETVQILTEHPEVLPKYEELAKQCAAGNMISLMSIIWRYHLLQKNTDKANQLWNEYLKENHHFLNVILPRIVGSWRVNAEYAQRVLKLLPEVNLLQEKKSVLYNNFLQFFCNEKLFEQGLEMLQDSFNQQMTLDLYSTSTLQTLQRGLESIGKTMPYTISIKSRVEDIPEDETGNSSDNDDESDRKVN